MMKREKWTLKIRKLYRSFATVRTGIFLANLCMISFVYAQVKMPETLRGGVLKSINDGYSSCENQIFNFEEKIRREKSDNYEEVMAMLNSIRLSNQENNGCKPKTNKSVSNYLW